MTADIYRGAASRYLAAGWTPIPIPHLKKFPPPSGSTGGAGSVSPGQVVEWERTEPGANVALRLSRDLVGFDVDAYKGGDKQLADAINRFGSLPPTIMSTSRDDGSGICLYRIPNGTILQGSIDSAVETVQFHHRYVMAAPSIHPEGRPYRWIDEASGEVLDEPWPIDEIPDLPWQWVSGLTVASTGVPAVAASSMEVTEFVAKHTERNSVGHLENLPARIARVAKEKCRHDTLVSVTTAALREAAAGAYSAADGVAVLRTWWVKVMDDPARIEGEFASVLAWAVGQVNADPQALTAWLATDIERTGNELHDTLVRTPVDVSALPRAVDGLNMTDTGNAERLIAASGEHLRYVPAWKQWIVWDETVWENDPGDVRVIEHAKSISRELWCRIVKMPADKSRDANIRWAKQSESATAIAHAVRLARGVPGVIIEHDELDSDPWLLNVANGTIDLQTGNLHRHNPEQLHSRTAGARWVMDAEAPRFEAFLEVILPDPEVRSYVQRAIGYSLTGSTGEQVIFLAIGNGSNGKSTLIEAVSKMMGDYAGPVAKDLIISQRHEAHPTSMADLFRLRFAVAMETEATNTLAEARVKALTGGDRVKARRMGENFWDFEPTHKLWLAANHLPKIIGTDNGIWRRIRVVPFSVEIDEAHRDPNLPVALANELPGILRWAVEGCLEWQRQGLNTPAIVTEATNTYQNESDWFPQFLDECGWELGNGKHTTAKALNNSFSDWVKINGENLTKNVLLKELEKHQCRQSRSGTARAWINIGQTSGDN